MWLVTEDEEAGPPLLFTVYSAFLRSRPRSQSLGPNHTSTTVKGATLKSGALPHGA